MHGRRKIRRGRFASRRQEAMLGFRINRHENVTPSNERREYVVLGLLSLAAVVSTGILSLSYGTFFEPYFGRVPPLPSIALVVLVNVVSLSILHSHGWFEIYTRKSMRG